MIELIGAHRFDYAQIIDVLFQMRKPVRDPGTALARLMKRILRSQQLWPTRDKRKSLAFQKRWRAFLAVEPRQLRLVVEQLQLARSTNHV